ncbi:hypothetical protein MMC30_000010 [Trapelia coarctata]|nr:hypothetical protein [Trapelia coarctata]
MSDPFPPELMQIRKKLATYHNKQGKLVKQFQEACPAAINHGRNVTDLEKVKDGLSPDFYDVVYKSEASQLAVAMKSVKAIKLNLESVMKEREQLMAQESSLIKQVLANICKDPGFCVKVEQDVKETETDDSSEEADETGGGEQAAGDRKRHHEEEGQEDKKD